jgi:heptosyltransferase III
VRRRLYDDRHRPFAPVEQAPVAHRPGAGSSASEPRVASVLVIVVTRIGDTLLATPSIRAIAKAYPSSAITVLAHPKRAEVLRHLPFVHRVGVIDKRRARWLGWFDRKRYDYAVVHGFDLPLVAYALRVARHVVAFRQADETINARLYHVVEPPAFQSMHAVNYQFALPAALGIAPDGYHLSYRVLPEEKQRAETRLQQAPGYTARPLVGLQVASFHTKAYRDWPVSHFAALAKRILESHQDAHFVLFGGKDDKAKTRAFCQALGERATDFAGRLSLRETAATMSLLDLYVGVDTGPTHLMGTLNRPMVVLYHAHSPSHLLAPRDHPCLYVIDHPLASPTAGTDLPMADISVDSVWEKVDAALRVAAESPKTATQADVAA